MRVDKLFFSDQWVYRIGRHALFWITRFLLMGLFTVSLSLVTQLMVPEAEIKYAWIKSSPTAIVGILIDMAYCYSVIYWLIPRFLPRKKYWSFAFIIVFITGLFFVGETTFFSMYYGWTKQSSEILNTALLYQTSTYINSGPPVICVFFLGLKMLKEWYKEQEKKITIAKENAQAELQLLKAQMHPHFLFNTLNNIYSFTLTKDPNAENLVTRLSGLIDYMNAEGEKDLVPVEKEIQLIRDYISLEKVRYGDRLEVQVDISGEYENKLIAPLLLIPFVENSFKHGASVNRGKQWLRLTIESKGNHLCFDLSNSKSIHPAAQNGKKGIGLLNVSKRLQLIYPGKHLLQIISTDMAYAIHLEMVLDVEPIAQVEHDESHHRKAYSSAG